LPDRKILQGSFGHSKTIDFFLQGQKINRKNCESRDFQKSVAFGRKINPVERKNLQNPVENLVLLKIGAKRPKKWLILSIGAKRPKKGCREAKNRVFR